MKTQDTNETDEERKLRMDRELYDLLVSHQSQHGFAATARRISVWMAGNTPNAFDILNLELMKARA